MTTESNTVPGVFYAPDGTELSYREMGTGETVVCLPGGPMQDSRYLGDLGGLSARHRLIVLALRGTGLSTAPEDVTSYRCDRLVGDVEALRTHLGLDSMNLLGHSAGTNLAVLYAVAHPERVDRLLLITPSLAAVGIDVSASDRRQVAQLRKGEAWFPRASSALSNMAAGQATTDDLEAVAPFFYGRWDSAARAHREARVRQINQEAAGIYGSERAYVPHEVRTVLSTLEPPTLVLAGELDVNTPPISAAKFARLFPDADLAVQPGASHFPWLDDSDRFVATTSAFLTAGRSDPLA